VRSVPKWLVAYGVAFALLLGAGISLGASALGLLESTRLLWLSSALSAGAVVAAVASLVLSRR